MVACYLGAKRHCKGGNVADLPDTCLAGWARWRGKPARFATEFRRIFQRSNGRLRWWEKFNGERQDRAGIPDRVRAAVFLRDGGKCLRCGSMDDLQLDHVHPRSAGGSDEPENLQLLCGSCNREKGATL